MKSGIKTLAVWLILGVIFIVLLSSVMDNVDSKMKYSELLEQIDAGEVKSIEVASNGTEAVVEFNNDERSKTVNIPSLDSLMEYIQEPMRTGAIEFEEK